MNPRHVTAALAIAYVHFVTEGSTTLTVGQLRVWAHRGHIGRVGTDPSGFALYDLNAIIRRVNTREHVQTSSNRVISGMEVCAQTQMTAHGRRR